MNLIKSKVKQVVLSPEEVSEMVQKHHLGNWKQKRCASIGTSLTGIGVIVGGLAVVPVLPVSIPMVVGGIATCAGGVIAKEKINTNIIEFNNEFEERQLAKFEKELEDKYKAKYENKNQPQKEELTQDSAYDRSKKGIEKLYDEKPRPKKTLEIGIAR